MSWLLNSLEPTVAEGFLFLDSVREIWKSIAEMYGSKKNVARVYQLQVDISKTMKGEKAFHTYLNYLKAM